MTNKEKTSFAIEALKASGCDKGQCVSTFVRAREVTALSGNIELLRSVSEHVSMDLTAYKDGKKGSIHISSGDEEDIRQAARACLESSKGGKADNTPFMNEIPAAKEFSGTAREFSVDTLLMRTQEFLQEAKARYPQVMIRQLILLYESQERHYKNTEGTELSSNSESYQLSVMVSGFEGSKNSSFYSYSFSFDDLNQPLMEKAMIAKCLEDAQHMVNTVRAESKHTGTLLVAPHCLRGFISQMLNAFASSGALIGGNSRWQNAVGTVVADSCFTLKSCPLSSAMAKNVYFTDDGFETEDVTLIENGVLKTLCPNYYTANKTGLAHYRGAASYVIEPGDKELQEIIASIDNGILINRFSGGNAGASGELSGIAKNSFFIKDGKLGEAAGETMISCNLAEMLLNIGAISRECVNDGVSSLPYIAFKNVTIF